MSRAAPTHPALLAALLAALLLPLAAPVASAEVRVSVPPAVIGPARAFDASVAAGADTELRLPVWLAAGQPRAVAAVTAVGGRARCEPRVLRAGAVTTLTCRVRVAARGPRQLTVRVTVRSDEGVLARRAFVREVTGRRT